MHWQLDAQGRATCVSAVQKPNPFEREAGFRCFVGGFQVISWCFPNWFTPFQSSLEV